MSVPNSPPTDLQAGIIGYRQTVTTLEFYLSLEVLLFGLVVVLLESWLLRKGTATADEMLRVYAVTLIIVGTLFGITAGFSAQQIAPAMGLFGTIAGYVLGRRQNLAEPLHKDAKTIHKDKEAL